jgi:hypothetical protein
MGRASVAEKEKPKAVIANWLLRNISDLAILPRWIIVVIDLAVVAVSTFFGYLLRFNFVWADVMRYDLPLGVAVQVAVSLLAIY